MRIATEVKGYITAPPPDDIIYAPYDIALDLSDGLVARGHEVDFYAPEGSATRRATLVTLGQTALVKNYDSYVGREKGVLFDADVHSDNLLALYDQRYSREMFLGAQAKKYDVLHFHHPEVALPYVQLFPETPVIHTMHDPIDARQNQLIESHYSPNQWLVSISDYQRVNAPNLPYISTVYNGIDTEQFAFAPDVERDRLLYAGRIVPEKGVKEAVEVARESGYPLDIIGPVFSDSAEYFREHIEPHLCDSIRYLGHIPKAQLPPHFQRARAFLMPINWDEPFGLTMAEAMSCGTPVIAFRRGSVPEIVADGETGFVVDDVEGMVEATGDVGEISPQDCRVRVANKFSLPAMVAGYEKVYEEALRRAA